MDSSVAKIPLQDCKMANSDLQDQILHQNSKILDLTEKLCLTNAHLVPKQKQLIAKLEDEVQYWKRRAEEATARCEKQQEDVDRMRGELDESIDETAKNVLMLGEAKEAYNDLYSKFTMESERLAARMDRAEAESKFLVEATERSRVESLTLRQLANHLQSRQVDLMAMIRAKDNLLQDQAERFERIRQALPVPTEAPPAYDHDHDHDHDEDDGDEHGEDANEESDDDEQSGDGGEEGQDQQREYVELGNTAQAPSRGAVQMIWGPFTPQQIIQMGVEASRTMQAQGATQNSVGREPPDGPQPED